MNGSRDVREDMRIQRYPICILVAATVLLMAACSIVPFRLLNSGAGTPQPVIVLSRCDEVQDVLCLVTFGLEPPDQMLIVLLASPGFPAELEAEITHGGSTLSYPCEPASQSETLIYCIGSRIPLGSSLQIQIYTTEERILLASGEFVLTALVLPTAPANGVALPTPDLLMTARPTRTPILGTAYPNPNRQPRYTPAPP